MNSRMTKTQQEKDSGVSNWAKTLLALATFSPATIGCLTSTSDGQKSDTRSQIAKGAAANNAPISAAGEFIHNPGPQELLDACKKVFRESGISEEPRLNERGRVQILRDTIDPAGTTRREYSDLFFPGQEVVVSKQDGNPYIREVARNPAGFEHERYRSISQQLGERKSIIGKLDSNSFNTLKDAADTNQDGVVSKDELSKALKNPLVKGPAAQLVAASRQAYSVLEPRGDGLPGISSKDFGALKLPDNKDLGTEFNSALFRSGATVGNATSLYGVKGYPTPFDAAAGFASNNGHLIAAINALCAARPAAIGEMIKPSSSGSGFEVRFGSKTVEVPIPTESDVITFTTCGEDGYWMAVLVKAYCQLMGEANGTREINPESNFSNVDSLKSPEKLMRSFGGLPVRKLSFGLFGRSEDSLDKELTKAVAGNRAVCVATSNKARLNGDRSIGGITLEPNQVYAVVGYDPTTREVTILSPRRNIKNESLAADLSDGVAKMPLGTLMKNSPAVFIEDGHPSGYNSAGRSIAERFPQ